MSVPPQQPGPYGQQPGQFGQQPGQFGGQPGPGQQPGGYPPPPPGFPQGGQPQPGYGPPPGGFQQPGPGQPGQPGQQPPYGQPGQYPPGYGQPGGFGDPYGAPRKKSPLPWILAGGGILVIGVVLALVFTLGGGNGTAKDAADSFATAISNKDYEKLRSLTCAENQKDIDDLKKAYDPSAINEDLEKNLDSLPPEFKEKAKKMQEAAKNIKMVASVKNVTEKDSTHAEAEIAIKLEGVPDELKEFIKDDLSNKVPFLKTDDGWVACEQK
ncbi:hypothetical protein [Saccharothrix obliqua]|uniref:hypothetical protein n=1 Tax=Saccharothrix obliqua TaxID=2861747 RepID=UPI001C5D353C|nr:hypothetical protein [Saccharothrix obliqua]MBW4717675.1 hypothetical protein [Saccharothrix obliqua]